MRRPRFLDPSRAPVPWAAQLNSVRAHASCVAPPLTLLLVHTPLILNRHVYVCITCTSILMHIHTLFLSYPVPRPPSLPPSLAPSQGVGARGQPDGGVRDGGVREEQPLLHRVRHVGAGAIPGHLAGESIIFNEATSHVHREMKRFTHGYHTET